PPPAGPAPPARGDHPARTGTPPGGRARRTVLPRRRTRPPPSPAPGCGRGRPRPAAGPRRSLRRRTPRCARRCWTIPCDSLPCGVGRSVPARRAPPQENIGLFLAESVRRRTRRRGLPHLHLLVERSQAVQVLAGEPLGGLGVPAGHRFVDVHVIAVDPLPLR